MNELWKPIKVYAKAIWVFLVGTFLPPFIKFLTGEAPWPQSKNEWITWGTTVGGSAVAALLVRNKITQDQLDKDPNVIGGVVVPDEDIPRATVNSPNIPVLRTSVVPDSSESWPKP